VSYPNGKYLLLIFLIFSAIFGVSFVHFFDPLVIFERTLTIIFYPLSTFFIDFFTNVKVYEYQENLIVLIFFMVILNLEFLNSRFWCRNLCPLGGILGLISKVSLFKFTIVKDCRKCPNCDINCPTDAIDFESKKIKSDECIGCLRCLNECSVGIIKYKLNLRPSPFNIRRREFIFAFGSAVFIAPFANLLLNRKNNGRLIRPPGSIPEQDFLNTCIRCGKCLKVCPTNGLQPVIFENGVNPLWTPHLVPRIGGCEKNCNMCGKVCPTQAIRRLSLEEKTYAKMGTAIIDRFRCIAWAQNRDCLICDEACQYNAISLIKDDSEKNTVGKPIVNEKICVGCGVCENRCPIEGSAAIQVYTIGEERKRTGSYITDEKKQLRACESKEEGLPSGFIIEDK